MRRTIYKYMCVLIAAAIFLTSGLTFFAYCRQFSKNIKNEIIEESEIVTKYLNMMKTSDEDTEILQKIYGDNTDLRITLIKQDGTVIFDNMADVSSMENHLERPEVISALSNGTGESKRHSETAGVEVYYYAIHLDNGNILRVAKSSDSIFRTVTSVIPVLFASVMIILIVLFFIVNKLMKKLMKPINEMDLDRLSEAEVYDELKPFLKRIEKNNAEKEETEKIRREFSANVSHELKTPLTSISGYAQMISNGMAKDEDIRCFGEKIEKEADRLILLINDIIRLSNLDESGGIENPEVIDLYESAQEVLLHLSDSAKKHGIQIFLGGQSVYISGSRTLIGELIYNLVDNAIKYNRERGRITVTTGENAEGAVITVRDTGIGIPDEEKERIFERFYRVDKSHSKTVGGTGLGLSIVKHVAICHNAQIKVKSKVGAGTEISVIFKGIQRR